MPKVIVEESTVFKTSVIGSDELALSEKTSVIKGTVLMVTDYSPARNQHIWLQFDMPLTAADGTTQLQEGYAYEPHVKLEGEEVNQVIKLDVPYFSQLNNDSNVFGSGSRQCNTTANAMLADYLLEGELTRRAREQGLNEPESAYIPLVAKYGDTTDHGAQTEALRDLGVESYFSYTLSEKDLLASLRVKVPVVIGVAYRSSGHIIVVIGYDHGSQRWLMNDPYGIRYGASDSYEVGANGAGDIYSQETMQRIYWDMGREAGWGRIVTSVRGQPTGLPTGL
jgi:hypothetical protein